MPPNNNLFCCPVPAIIWAEESCLECVAGLRHPALASQPRDHWLRSFETHPNRASRRSSRATLLEGSLASACHKALFLVSLASVHVGSRRSTVGCNPAARCASGLKPLDDVDLVFCWRALVSFDTDAAWQTFSSCCTNPRMTHSMKYATGRKRQIAGRGGLMHQNDVLA